MHMETRHVTVASTTRYRRTQDRNGKSLAVEHMATQTPMIRLRGNWLLAAGFAIGEPVAITVAPGALVLKSASLRRAGIDVAPVAAPPAAAAVA